MTSEQIIVFFAIDILLGVAGGLAVHYRTRLRRAQARTTELRSRLAATEHLLAQADPRRASEISALKAQLALPSHQRAEQGR
jgi:hypothetical protein